MPLSLPSRQTFPLKPSVPSPLGVRFASTISPAQPKVAKDSPALALPEKPFLSKKVRNYAFSFLALLAAMGVVGYKTGTVSYQRSDEVRLYSKQPQQNRQASDLQEDDRPGLQFKLPSTWVSHYPMPSAPQNIVESTVALSADHQPLPVGYTFHFTIQDAKRLEPLLGKIRLQDQKDLPIRINRIYWETLVRDLTNLYIEDYIAKQPLSNLPLPILHQDLIDEGSSPDKSSSDPTEDTIKVASLYDTILKTHELSEISRAKLRKILLPSGGSDTELRETFAMPVHNPLTLETVLTAIGIGSPVLECNQSEKEFAKRIEGYRIEEYQKAKKANAEKKKSVHPKP